ncbi:MAG: sulfatase-like hydrolase/transferase, partial [Armatimonadetes bacterium]|nr:sulfatase-like hydrolase/transferase [Armatimonadota bacterium]
MDRALNFLCFVTDQMRGDHMGCDGNPVIQTPNIDRLAATGVRFTRAYCNNPLCMPSRATLFTGKTPRGHGVRTNGIPLGRTIPTVVQALAEAGYRTHSVGKLHMLPYGTPNGVDPASLRPDDWVESAYFWDNRILKSVPTPYYGFQTVELTIGHGPGTTGDYRRWLWRVAPEAEKLLTPEAGKPTPHCAEQSWHNAIPEELHYNAWVADRAIEFLERHDTSEPFFLWCSFPDPHHPFCPPEPWASTYDPADVPMPVRREGELDDLPPHYKAIYETSFWLSGRAKATKMSDDQLREIIALTYGMISHVDYNIGRVIAALEKLGLRNNTVICFLSDHGDMMGDHWMMNKGPFHFEGLLRVPFIWSCLGLFPEGRVVNALVSFLDFAPTILELAGVAIPEGLVPAERETQNELPPWPGRSLATILKGAKEAIQDSVVVENDEDYLGLRLRTLVTDRYKITAYPGQP